MTVSGPTTTSGSDITHTSLSADLRNGQDNHHRRVDDTTSLRHPRRARNRPFGNRQVRTQTADTWPAPAQPTRNLESPRRRSLCPRMFGEFHHECSTNALTAH